MGDEVLTLGGNYIGFMAEKPFMDLSICAMARRNLWATKWGSCSWSGALRSPRMYEVSNKSEEIRSFYKIIHSLGRGLFWDPSPSWNIFAQHRRKSILAKVSLYPCLLSSSNSIEVTKPLLAKGLSLLDRLLPLTTISPGAVDAGTTRPPGHIQKENTPVWSIWQTVYNWPPANFSLSRILFVLYFVNKSLRCSIPNPKGKWL